MALSSNIDREKVVHLAGEYAIEAKHMGYHCSESMIRAIPHALGLDVSPDVVRCACGFFGGGGGTGGRCGIVEIGIMLISYLFGRMHPLMSEQDLRVLIPELTHRFEAEAGSLLCGEIKPTQVEMHGTAYGCEDIYRRGAMIVTRLLLEADELLAVSRNA